MNYTLPGLCAASVLLGGCVIVQIPNYPPPLVPLTQTPAPTNKQEDILLPLTEEKRRPTVCDPVRGEDQDADILSHGDAYNRLDSSCI